MEVDIMYNMCYNEFNYIYSIHEGETMSLNSILERYINSQCSKIYSVSEKSTDYIKYIEDAPFFVSPEMHTISNSTQSSVAKLVIISAPGAVGKTTFAKYFAAQTNAIYWDLAKLTVGTGTFEGAILSAIGLNKICSFMQDIAESKVLFAFDAFDEAEMISGRRMLCEFINDIAKVVPEVDTPCALLFARTTTAQFIAAFCKENGISFEHYEIGYFDKDASVEFIFRSCNEKASRLVIENYVNRLREYSFCEPSFIGYAPVLQVLSKHIVSEPNTIHVVNTLNTENTVAGLICDIMQELLNREHTIVVNALKNRCAEKCPDFSNWESIYTPEEQLGRILLLLLFGQSEYSDWRIENIPIELVDDYMEVLKYQLKQHPFLIDTSEGYAFAGPAFKDYTLAYSKLQRLLISVADLFCEEGKTDNYLPSTVFFDCYAHLSDGLADFSSLDLLYKSFCAHSHAGEYTSLLICEEGDNYNISFSRDSKVSIDFTIPVTDTDSVSFESLSNVVIDAPSLVVLMGTATAEARISNSSIVCKQINWNSRTTTIEVSEGRESIIVAEENMQGQTLFYCVVNGTLKAYTTNLTTYYKLHPYYFEYASETSLEELSIFAHRVGCILSCFRSHGKDTLGKTADYVKNIIVGSSKPKQCILEFLLDSRIVYEEDHLYKINIDLLSDVGISFSSVLILDISAYEQLFIKFLNYHKNS